MTLSGAHRRRPGAAPEVHAAPMLSLLLFEAADCLMALQASEVARLLTPESHTAVANEVFASRERIDLDEYFAGCRSEGPWLQWGRGKQTAWLRVRRVLEVVPCAIATLSPMPARLRVDRLAGAFWAAGIRGDDVFLLLDPGRLVTNAVAGDVAGS